MSRRYNQVLLVSVTVAFTAWLLIWLAWGQSKWGADLAICVGYTILVAGLIYADRDSQIFSRRPIILITTQHACFLIGAVALNHAVMHIEPVLLAADAPKMHPSRGVPVLVMIGLAYGEKWILDRNPDSRPRASREESIADSGSKEPDQDR